VNVHPQKLEVRLLKQEALYSWITAAIRKMVAQKPTVGEMPFPKKSASPPVPVVSEAAVSLPYSGSTHANPPRPLVQTPLFSAPSIKYLGQIKASYLVCEDPEGLILFDQHALHEKIVFEKLQADFHQNQVPVQQLLIPKVVRLPMDLQPLLAEYLKTFSVLGFDIEEYGDGDIAVKSRPDLLEEDKIEPVLVESLRNAQNHPSESAVEQSLRPILATMACHSVVRANQTLSVHEAQSLLKHFDRIEHGWTCPHGRPILFRLNFGAIEKQFERI